MNLVRFKVTVRTPDGTRIPLASGQVRAMPTRLIVVPGDPDEMVPKTEVWRDLADGYAELTLDAPTASWCWRIRVLNASGNEIQAGYYTFAESVTPLDFPTDLTEVDPLTLAPTAAAVPAWEAAVALVDADMVAAAASALAASASAGNALASEQAAAGAASDASGSASAASDSASTASTKVGEASASASSASGSASAAAESAGQAQQSAQAAWNAMASGTYLVPDPSNPGLYLPTAGTAMVADPTHDGLYTIGTLA